MQWEERGPRPEPQLGGGTSRSLCLHVTVRTGGNVLRAPNRTVTNGDLPSSSWRPTHEHPHPASSVLPIFL